MATIPTMTTADGSQTLLHALHQESYHSSHGALRETNHVFLQGSDLERRLIKAREQDQAVCLLEIGLGTGLNFRASAKRADVLGAALDYRAFEPEPPPISALEALGYSALFDDAHWQQALSVLYHQSQAPGAKRREDQAPQQDLEPTLSQTHGQTRLTLYPQQAEKSALPTAQFDIIYLDAFSPKHCPELWQGDFLQRLAQALRPGGCLCTYAARGQLRRDLSSAGLQVTQPPGPPGKRQYTRAEKPLAPSAQG